MKSSIALSSSCFVFDEDASGDLSREEVLRQLEARQGVFTDPSAVSMMSKERWKELDWDGDGTITFREFIWAFQKWISTDLEETCPAIHTHTHDERDTHQQRE